MNVEWAIPFLLTTPRGTLAFNEQDSSAGGIFQLDAEKCSVKSALRLTRDDIPQGSGSILHREFRSGTVMHLVGAMMEDNDTPAQGALLREMWDTLGLHTNALECELLSDENDVAGRRIQWTPTSYGQDRILTAIRLFEDPTPALEQWTTFDFSIHSPYPYAVDETQHVDSSGSGGTITIDNPGNCPVYPDFKVYGATGLFIYTNETLGLSMVYDATLPGAISIPGSGEFGFFGHFANNAYLNGDEDNLKAGIDILNSDFFPLLPGENEIFVSGCDLDMIWNAGWRT